MLGAAARAARPAALTICISGVRSLTVLALRGAPRRPRRSFVRSAVSDGDTVLRVEASSLYFVLLLVNETRAPDGLDQSLDACTDACGATPLERDEMVANAFVGIMSRQCKDYTQRVGACGDAAVKSLRKGVLLCDTYIPHRRLPLDKKFVYSCKQVSNNTFQREYTTVVQ